MKPAWDQLMEEFASSKTALVADVDCTVEESLCQKHGVEGYPTIKYGDPAALKDYDGGRELDELKEFAKSNLGPSCGLKNLDLCDEAQKKDISDAQAMSNEQITEALKSRLEAAKKVNQEFEKAVEELEQKYQQLEEEKTAKTKALEKDASPATSTLKMVGLDRGLELPGKEDEEMPEDEELPEDGEMPEDDEAGADEEGGDDADPAEAGGDDL